MTKRIDAFLRRHMESYVVPSADGKESIKHDGDIVEVNGNTGIVTVFEKKRN